ncbi:conserved hypothetical protein [Streptomyces misionensis JCM 4497]
MTFGMSPPLVTSARSRSRAMLDRRRAGFRSAGITLSGRRLRRWTVRGRGSRWLTSVLTGLAGWWRSALLGTGRRPTRCAR